MDFTIISESPLDLANPPSPVTLIFPENGSTAQFPLADFTSSPYLKHQNAFMKFIEKEFNIPKSNQVILRAEDGKQLEPHMNLSDFLEKVSFSCRFSISDVL